MYAISYQASLCIVAQVQSIHPLSFTGTDVGNRRMSGNDFETTFT